MFAVARSRDNLFVGAFRHAEPQPSPPTIGRSSVDVSPPRDRPRPPPLLALAASRAQAGERHVVMILIDGLPAYLLDDPQASLPVIRGLAREGVAAKGGMRVSDPSITWPNQTSLVTGSHPDRHGVLFNGGLERRGPGKLVKYFASRTQQELVRVPLLFDVLKQAGQTSAAINWPCTRGSTSIDDNFPDVPRRTGLHDTTAQGRTDAKRAARAIRRGKRRRPGRDLDRSRLPDHPGSDASIPGASPQQRRCRPPPLRPEVGPRLCGGRVSTMPTSAGS